MKVTIPPHDREVLNTARAALYRFTSLAFRDPKTAPTWNLLNDPDSRQCVLAAGELVRETFRDVPIELGLGEHACTALDVDDVLNRLPASTEQLNAQFEQTFGLVVAGSCPPYETEYINGKLTFQRSHHLADISGYYRAFGLQPAAGSTERFDHVSLELEFLGALIRLEQQPGLENERADLCRTAQSRFLKDHAAWWLPGFARLLGRERPDSFYAAAGRLLASFLPLERTLLGVEPATQPIGLSPALPSEDCEGCLLNADVAT